jgi:hypothetical protein
MALVVEDGTGLANANSYISVAYADAYFTDRANAAWGTATQQAKEAALINASSYLDIRFSDNLRGIPLNPGVQALSFPRKHLPPCAQDLPLPPPVQKATAEYALRALAGPLLPDPTIDPSGYAVSSKREKVGPIEEETGYSTGNWAVPPVLMRPYPAADYLMNCLLLAQFGARQSRIIRN